MKFLTVVIYSKVIRLGFHTVPPHPIIVKVERNPRFCVGIVFLCLWILREKGSYISGIGNLSYICVHRVNPFDGDAPCL